VGQPHRIVGGEKRLKKKARVNLNFAMNHSWKFPVSLKLFKFEAILGYIMRLSLKKEKKSEQKCKDYTTACNSKRNLETT
jgi:hypothetical protein